MPVPVPVTCYLCTGKDCSKADGRDELATVLGDDPAITVERVRCQKVCKGPVAGLTVRGRLEWFGRLRTPKARRDLLRLAHDGAPSKRLAKRRSAKRSGRRRG